MGMKFLFMDDENVLKLIVVMVVNFKCVICMVHELYINEVVKEGRRQGGRKE